MDTATGCHEFGKAPAAGKLELCCYLRAVPMTLRRHQCFADAQFACEKTHAFECGDVLEAFELSGTARIAFEVINPNIGVNIDLGTIRKTYSSRESRSRRM